MELDRVECPNPAPTSFFFVVFTTNWSFLHGWFWYQNAHSESSNNLATFWPRPDVKSLAQTCLWPSSSVPELIFVSFLQHIATVGSASADPDAQITTHGAGWNPVEDRIASVDEALFDLKARCHASGTNYQRPSSRQHHNKTTDIRIRLLTSWINQPAHFPDHVRVFECLLWQNSEEDSLGLLESLECSWFDRLETKMLRQETGLINSQN